MLEKYFNLEQVARILGKPVDEVKSEIFGEARKQGQRLFPSWYIPRPVLVDMYIWGSVQDETGCYKETEEVGIAVQFTGIVRLSGARRDSAGVGELQLCQRYYENPEEFPATLLKLYHWNDELAREEIICLRESCRVSENSLIVHCGHLREYIADNPEAIERYEELLGSGCNAERPYLPSYLRPEHEYYAPELAALVEVWLELYEGGKYKENQAPKPQIADLLKKKGHSDTAIKEITRVAVPLNWKKGRAPTSGRPTK